MNALKFTARHFGREYAFDVLTAGASEQNDSDGDYVEHESNKAFF